jgi:hypothetical protein
MSGASRNCAAAVASGRGLNVSFAPKANKLLHGSETTRCANNGLMHRSKQHLYVCQQSGEALITSMGQFR